MILKSETKNFYDNIRVNSFEDVKNSVTPCLVLIKKDSGEFTLIAILNIIIKDLVSSFNIGKQMSPTQIAEASKMIIDEYYYLKPEDFKLCFTNAKKGYYGITYDRIDISIICQWLNVYCNDRASFFETEGNKKQIELKKEPIDYEAVKAWGEQNKNYMERNNKTNSEAYQKFKADRMKQELESKTNPEGNIKKENGNG